MKSRAFHLCSVSRSDISFIAWTDYWERKDIESSFCWPIRSFFMDSFSVWFNKFQGWNQSWWNPSYIFDDLSCCCVQSLDKSKESRSLWYRSRKMKAGWLAGSRLTSMCCVWVNRICSERRVAAVTAAMGQAAPLLNGRWKGRVPGHHPIYSAY